MQSPVRISINLLSVLACRLLCSLSQTLPVDSVTFEDVHLNLPESNLTVIIMCPQVLKGASNLANSSESRMMVVPSVESSAALLLPGLL